MNSFSARPRESVFVTWVSAGLCSLPACLPGGEGHREWAWATGTAGDHGRLPELSQGSLNLPWTWKVCLAGFLLTPDITVSAWEGQEKRGVYAFKDRRAALTSGQGVLRHCFLWQLLGQVTWTPFKVKDPENSSHCLHPLLRKAGLGFCGGLPDEEPDLPWKGRFGLNVP